MPGIAGRYSVSGRKSKTLALQTSPMATTHEFTVVITDSGIGGVGIAAEAYGTLKTQGPYSTARIIYYNALFDEQGGYNTLKSLPQKTTILDTALRGKQDDVFWCRREPGHWPMHARTS